ncbi:MAG: hypothetical protein U0840_04745 [Gemmataceae bacterium]
MKRLIFVVVLVLGTGQIRASDVESGPEVGSKVTKFPVQDCTGENKDKAVDYVDLRKDKVTVYLVLPQDKFSRPMNRFMKTLDDKVSAELKDVYLVGVWLTDDEEKTKTFLPRVQTSVNYDRTALTYFKGKDGPKGWNINPDAHLTVIVVDKNKVAARFAYNSVNDTEVPQVFKAISRLAKK